MTTLSRHESAETSLRTLLEDAGLPEPDEIEHRETSIVAKWHGPKAVVIVDLEGTAEDE